MSGPRSSRYPHGPRLPNRSGPPRVSRGAGEGGNFGRCGCSGSPTFMSSTVSNQWLVLPGAGFGLGGGGGEGRERFAVPFAACPGVLDEAVLAANFSFLAFCTQSGQDTSLAFADLNHLPQGLHRILILLMRGL